MAFDFPNSPTTGQTFTPSGGPTYTWNGYGWTVSSPIGPTPLSLNVQKFTASGTYTPTAGLSFAIVEAIGGGGGGGATYGGGGVNAVGGGGGSGGYSRRCLTAAQIGSSQTITIGSGGNGGTGAADGAVSGTAGGQTSFGSLCIANGGLPAPDLNGTYHPGGAGGPTGTAVGDIVAAGAPGGGSAWALSSQVPGGSSAFGGGAVNKQFTGGGGQTGISASNYGSGGSGGVTSGSANWANGGAGSPGFVIITEYIGGTAGIVGQTPTMTVLTSGSGNYIPPAGVSYIEARMVGGGAGGSGAGIGAAGTNTTFGAFTAGGAPASLAYYEGSQGGTASGATVNLTGGKGAAGIYASGNVAASGAGGNSYFGGGGGSTYNNTNLPPLNASPNTGGGGGGQGSGTGVGGGGGGAGGFCWGIIPSPAASIPWVVGVGGAGNASAGRGADGIIIITEYYKQPSGGGGGGAGGAPINSPVFTGDPQAPTASPGDADTSIATTAFVAAAVAAVSGGGGGAWISGDLKASHVPTAPAGWILWNDQTIGDASSGATNRANADTQALFNLYYASPYTDTSCPLLTSTGAATTRAAQGTAAAAFAAHCRMSLPIGAGRAIANAGTGSGLTARTSGDKVGAETTTQTVSTLVVHQHAQQGYQMIGWGVEQGDGSVYDALSTNQGTNPLTLSQGGGGAMNTISPMAFVTFIIKL